MGTSGQTHVHLIGAVAGGAPKDCCAKWEQSLWIMAGLWLVIAAVSTWFFAATYVPTLSDAYSSIVHAEGVFGRSDQALGMLPRIVKWCAEQALVVTALMLIAVMWWRRSFSREIGGPCGVWRWWLAVGVLGLAAGWSFFGQLLPMDQHAWHGTVVRAGIIESTPVIGPMLKRMILGGESISGSTLTLFHGLHVGMFPALMLLAAVAALRPVIRRLPVGGPGGTADWMAAAVAASVLLQLVVLAWVAGGLATELGMAARSHMPHPDVRPEWFFMPLSKALAVVGPGVLGTLVVLAPGGVITLLVVWPWVAKRLSRAVHVAVLCGLGAVFCGLLAWEVGEDWANSAGWFAQTDLETLMTEMGKVNEKLGYAGEHKAETAFALAAELQVMARMTHDLDTHKKSKDAAKWREWSLDMGKHAEAIWASGGDSKKVSAAIASMRLACKQCHEQHDEEDVKLFDSPRAARTSAPSPTADQPQSPTPTKPTPPPTHPDPTPPVAATPDPVLAPLTYFHPSDFEGLRPTFNMALKIKGFMKQMNVEYDLLNGPNKAAYPMAIVNLEASWADTANRYADFEDIIEAEAWNKIVAEGLAATTSLRTAANEAEYRSRLKLMRAACIQCHEECGEEKAKIKPVRE